MAREIRAASPGTAPNDFKDRLIKLIPSEIITAYISILGLIHASTMVDNIYLLWFIFFVLLSLTPLYLYNVSNIKKSGQIIFTMIAFVIWVIVVGGGPFDRIGVETGTMSLLGSILLILYTLFVPFVYKG